MSRHDGELMFAAAAVARPSSQRFRYAVEVDGLMRMTLERRAREQGVPVASYVQRLFEAAYAARVGAKTGDAGLEAAVNGAAVPDRTAEDLRQARQDLAAAQVAIQAGAANDRELRKQVGSLQQELRQARERVGVLEQRLASARAEAPADAPAPRKRLPVAAYPAEWRLTPTETNMLALLAATDGPVSRLAFADGVGVTGKSVDVYLSSLRRKTPLAIATVVGGWALTDEARATLARGGVPAEAPPPAPPAPASPAARAPEPPLSAAELKRAKSYRAINMSFPAIALALGREDVDLVRSALRGAR